MRESYNLCLTQVLQYEGGYVNHPQDPGGATNKGITQRVYDVYRRRKAARPQSVKLISMDEVKDIYRNEYWDKVHGDELPVGVDLAVFDFAVNSGVSRAVHFLQSLVGVPVDGIIGPKTLAATNDKQFGLVDRFCDERLRFLNSLRTFATFGKGWSRRVADVRRTAKAMRKAYAEANPK